MRSLRPLLWLFVTGGVIFILFMVTALYPFWSMVVSLFVLGFLAFTYQIWLWWLLRKIAESGRNFVVNVQEGTGKLIMKNGKADRGITADPKTDPDQKTWNLIQEDGACSTAQSHGLRTEQAKLSPLFDWIDRNLLPGGMRWRGFGFMGYDVMRYNFRWEVLRGSEPLDNEDGLIGKRKLANGKWVASFAKEIDYIYVKDAVYYFEITGAEVRGMGGRVTDGKEKKSVGMPVDIHAILTVRIVNFYLAILFIHDWLESTFDLLRPSVRSWAARSSYEDVIGKPEVAERVYDVFLGQKGLTDEMIEEFRKKNPTVTEGPKSLADYLECSYGVRPKRLNFDDVIPPDEYTEAAIRRMEAEQESIAIQTLADANAGKITTLATAEAAAIKTVNAELLNNPTALDLRRLMALENIGDNGNLIVIDGNTQHLFINPDRGKGGQGWTSPKSGTESMPKLNSAPPGSEKDSAA